MRIRRLLIPFSLVAIGLNLGFSALPAIYVPPAHAQTMIHRAATLTAQEPGSRINVRSAPSTSAPIRHYGLVGDSVAVLQESKRSDDYPWYFVQFPASQATGWIRGDLLILSNRGLDNDAIETLPNVEGIRFRAVTYERAQLSSAPALETAIARELSGNVTNVRYLYNPIDLDGDGRYEAVVYLIGSSTCGTGGCTMMIFKSTGSGYRLVSRNTIVNNPIVVSNTTTNGWRDLIVYVAGGGAEPSYRTLKFNGSTYPSNPSTAPKVPAGTIVAGNAVIADKISPGVGLPISSSR